MPMPVPESLSHSFWREPMSTRLILADDHLLVREGCRSLLERGGMDVVGEASDGYEAVRLAQRLQPDVAVLDVSMPLLNGLDTARQVRQVSPRTKIILLTIHDEPQYVLEALHVGIRGYVLKRQSAADLTAAIREVLGGALYLSPGVSRAVVEAYLHKSSDPTDPLTARERQVLQLVAEGKGTKEVAALLGISVKTAESHRTRIMQKLEIHQTAGLVRYAIRRGLVQA
ncbi:MAG: DNA-binding response regulator [Acidobacteria bacterium]|nr:MAG: DNA-binding response regulator [Acidobacteriota bacterium]PYQ83318.1 MAG: DNA-binding response regulator [Acidobacteriota bacterium]